ncbi:MAG: ATP synthase F1 subunit delta [Bergeyella sp.]|nr:ATP synthase F1 subunit delta [Bergeyella sp.]
MMSDNKIAQRYAGGLFNLAKELNNVDIVFKEMESIVRLFYDSKEFRCFIESPLIDKKKKISVAEAIFSGFSKTSLDFVRLIISNGRGSALGNMAKAYVHNVNKRKGIQTVVLTSAVALDRKVSEDIIRSSQLLNKEASFRLETVINPDILGGYILRVGDQQIDTSVRSQLDKIKKDFHLHSR